MDNNSGRLFRQAWIDGVRRYYPGDPKPGYVASWDATPDWERQAATTVYELVAALVRAGGTTQLTRQQKGQFVALCWTAQIFAAFEDPKPSYVAAWDLLPEWQQETDADIFEEIEARVR